MTEDKVLLTEEGLKKLKDELEHLKLVKRPEISEKIRIARGFGDLSENAEYDEAKLEQAQVETRISQVELQIKNAHVISNDKGSDTISLGDSVVLLDTDTKKELKLKLVGTVEANLMEGKISNESPVGKAILGKKKDDIVEVITKAKTIRYKVIEIIE